MKIKNIILAATSIIVPFVVASCGYYTNFPAQYHIDGLSDLNASITYDSAGGAKVKLPKLIIKGEPGSIGANFDRMVINYGTASFTNVSLSVSYKVNSSHFRDASGNPVVDGGTYELPIINSKIIDYGRSTTATTLSATVTLSGQDDANWPTGIDNIGIPITFIQGGGKTATNP